MYRKRFAIGVLALGVLAAVVAVSCSNQAQGRPESADSGEAVTSDFQVEGMTCWGCELAVKRAVKKLDGVREVDASHREASATVTYDPAKVTPPQIVQAIEEIGYTAEPVPERPQA